MGNLHDDLIQYVEQTYKLDSQQAEDLWNRLGSTLNTGGDNAVVREIKSNANNSGYDRIQLAKDWIDQAASDLGIQAPQPGQGNAAAPNPGNLQSDLQAAAASPDPVKAANDLITKYAPASIPAKVLQQLGGVPPTAQQAQAAVDAWNRLHPNDHISDPSELYQRINYSDPDALNVLATQMEGAGNVAFSVWNPNSQMMETKTVGRDAVTTATDLNASLGSQANLGEIISYAHRTGDEVPWQLLNSAVALTTKGKTITPQPDLNTAITEAVNFTSGGPELTKQLQDGIRKYGDYGLALIALKNPTLADAIYNAGGATADQAREAAQIYLDAGYDPSTMAKMGLAIDPVKYKLATDPTAGPAGVKVQLPDPAQLESAARQLYQVWFAREATPSELSQFIQTIDTATTAKAQATVGNLFKGTQGTGSSTETATDIQGQLEQQLRNTPEYNLLFGQKPVGVSEQDYANQFRQADSGMIGSGLPNSNAVRLGMQTGNPEDTIRYQFGDKSSLDNSSFEQRLAQAARAIAAVT
jgi:hypothetical protein